MLKSRWGQVATTVHLVVSPRCLDRHLQIFRRPEKHATNFRVEAPASHKGSSFRRQGSTCLQTCANQQPIHCKCQTCNMFQQIQSSFNQSSVRPVWRLGLTHADRLETWLRKSRNHWISSELHLWIDGFRCQCQLQRSSLHVIKTPCGIGETRAQQGEGDHANGSGRNSNQIGKANAQQRIPPAAWNREIHLKYV